jgi:hypothetical protein
VRGEGPFFERMVVWERRSRNGLGEPLQPKACHRGAPDVVVAYGNHAVSAPSLGPIVPCDGIEILHFPMRTHAQFAAQIEQGAQALASNASLGPRMGSVWRELERLRRRGELARYYERYVVDPDDVRAGRGGDELEIDERLRRYMEALLSARETPAAASRGSRPAPRGDPRCGR